LMSVMDRGAIAGRHVAGVEDILDADRNAVERAPPRLAVTCPRLRDSEVAVDIGPGADGGIALGNAGKARLDQRLGCRGARFEPLRGVERGHLIQSGRSCSLQVEHVRSHTEVGSATIAELGSVSV